MLGTSKLTPVKCNGSRQDAKPQVRGNEHAIVIPESVQDDDWASHMQRVLRSDPVLLSIPAVNTSHSIHKVPPSLRRKMNRKYFDPLIVSIGPYHHGRREYQMLQNYKARYFNLLVTRSGRHATNYFEAVKAKSDEIKSCYGKDINYKDEDLVTMIVTDGCFIIEMFRMVKGLVPESKKDPNILNMAELFPFFLRDFLLLENQIPFFALQLLFNMSKTSKDGGCTLIELASNFIEYVMPRPLQFPKLKKDHSTSKVKHLLDLLRLSMTDASPVVQKRRLQAWKAAYIPRIPAATKLGLRGIRIKRRYGNLIDIGFGKGWLKIPVVTLDGFVCSFLSNCVALEKCYDDSTKHFSAYVALMRDLTNKEADVEFLSNERVLKNYLETDADVECFFKTLAGVNKVDIRKSYLADVFFELDNYHESTWHQIWVEFWNTYFSSPWSFLSAAAIFFGLLFTAIQAYYAIFSKN